MLMRMSMAKEPWWKKQSDFFHEGLDKAFPNPPSRKDLHSLHITRQLEYPWVLHHCPPTGRVLDTGSDSQFFSSLVAQNISVVSHHTWVDASVRGYVFPGKNDPRQSISMDQFYRKYRHQTVGILGLFEDMQFIQPDWFDTIYCISVLEHLENKDEVAEWIHGMKRILRPGGRLCVTCDWFSKWKIDDGMGHNEEYGTAYVMNWNLEELAKDFGDLVEGNEREIPWHPRFDPESVKDTDLMRIIFVGQELVVYGFVLEKAPATIYHLQK